MLAALIVLGAAGSAMGTAPPSADDYAARATVKDDPLDTVVTITTERGGAEPKKNWLGLAPLDTGDRGLLRIFVTRKDGSTSIQVYHRVGYGGRGWRFYRQVNYETPAGPQSAELLQIHSDVGCYGSGCGYSEIVGFDVGEALFRRISSACSSGWRYRLKSEAGVDTDWTMPCAELAGALLALDRWRSAHTIPFPASH